MAGTTNGLTIPVSGNVTGLGSFPTPSYPATQYAQAPYAMSPGPNGAFNVDRQTAGNRMNLVQQVYNPSGGLSMGSGYAPNRFGQPQNSALYQNSQQPQPQNAWQQSPYGGGQQQMGQNRTMGQVGNPYSALQQNAQTPSQQASPALAQNAQQPTAQMGQNPTDSQQSQVSDYLNNTYNGIYSPGSGANNFGLGTGPGTLGPTGNMNGSQYAAWQGTQSRPGQPVGIGMFGNMAGPGQNGAMINSLSALQQNAQPQQQQAPQHQQDDSQPQYPNIFARQMGGAIPQGNGAQQTQQRNFNV